MGRWAARVPGGAARAGNWVNDQFQLDAFGESLLLFAAAAENDRLDLEHWKAAEICADAIMSRWQEPDAGMWELDNRRWAHSRLICAAGLRAIGRNAPAQQGAKWTSQADILVTDVANDCLHPSGRWQRAPDDDRVDASLLLPVIRGALPPDDPRSVATLKAVQDNLARDEYLYRFRQDGRALARSEGAFLLCGFDMAMALHQSGETTEAARWFEETGLPAVPPASLRRSMTSSNANSGGTSPRPLYTPPCSKPRADWRNLRPRGGA